MTTIKIQSPNGKGKFNLRSIVLGKECGSRGYSKMYRGTTDKGREVYVLVFDYNTNSVGVKDANISPNDASCTGWNNQYDIIERSN